MGLVAPGAGVVELLCGARPGPREFAFADERLLRVARGRERLVELGPARSHVRRPGGLCDVHPLLLGRDVGRDDRDLLAARRDLAVDARRVEPRDDGTGRYAVALHERDLVRAGGYLAAQQALLALDEAGVDLARGLAAAVPPGGARGGEQEKRDRDDLAGHGYSVAIGRPIRRCSSALRTCAW